METESDLRHDAIVANKFISFRFDRWNDEEEERMWDAGLAENKIWTMRFRRFW